MYIAYRSIIDLKYWVVSSILIFFMCCDDREIKPDEKSIIIQVGDTASFDLLEPEAVLSMLDLSIGTIGDAILIQIKNGKTILIDTGTEEQAEKIIIPYLNFISLNKIDYIFISHSHLDHYGGLSSLILSDLEIGAIYFNITEKAKCETENEGCDYETIMSIVEQINARQIPFFPCDTGIVFELSQNTTLKILYAFNDINSPVGNIDINDESVVMLLKCKEQSVLFTGDLNNKVGSFLQTSGRNIKADIIKIPHHGATGIVPCSFIEAVDPKYAIISASEDLWNSNLGDYMRNCLINNNIETYVTGLDGNIHIYFY